MSVCMHWFVHGFSVSVYRHRMSVDTTDSFMDSLQYYSLGSKIKI